MLIDMKYINMFEGYDPKCRFSTLVDRVSRTIQDAIVDIPSLLKEFNGRLDDLFDKYNNGLVFESVSGTGVFIDELDSKQVEAYNKFMKDKADAEAKALADEALFNKWKESIAQHVVKSRSEGTDAPSEQKEEPKSSN